MTISKTVGASAKLQEITLVEFNICYRMASLRMLYSLILTYFNILWTYVFGGGPNSNLVRICVLGFSANRVWLVSSFYICFASCDRIEPGRAGIVDKESI